jgi:hypothetical protein
MCPARPVAGRADGSNDFLIRFLSELRPTFMVSAEDGLGRRGTADPPLTFAGVERVSWTTFV